MIRNTRSGRSLLFSGHLKKVCIRKNRRNLSASVPSLENGNVGTVKTIYERWLNDPNNVAPAWDTFFRTVALHERSRSRFSIASSRDRHEEINRRTYHDRFSFEYDEPEDKQIKDLQQVLLVHRLISSYQNRGHHLAKLDPLEYSCMERLPLFGRGKGLLYRHYADEHKNLLSKVQYELNMDNIYPLPVVTTQIGGEFDKALRLSEIISRLEKVYCDRIGLEYMHINSSSQCDYLRKQFEPPTACRLSMDQKRLLFARLARSIGFEEFFDKYYPQSMKYSLEGCEVLIPCIKSIIDHCTDYGVDHFIFGMSHRGRMNVLANVFRVPLVQIMSLFNHLDLDSPAFGGSMYHLGTDRVKLNRISNKKTRLTMLAAPSHLESVNAVVLGRTKIEQMMRTNSSNVMSILVHGDMAFSGQGISYEVLNLSDLPAFNTLGTIHIILNNQVGSASDAQTTRSHAYSTDLGKIMNAPIFHVNADDPEAVLHVSRVAANWRNTFKSDCILELVAYRRHGDSTLDDLMITNPSVYNKIKETPNVYEKYVDYLRDDNTISEDEARSHWSNRLEMANVANPVKSAKKGKKGGKEEDDEREGQSEEPHVVKEFREIIEEIKKIESIRQERRKRLRQLKDLKRNERVKLAEKLLQIKRIRQSKKNKKE